MEIENNINQLILIEIKEKGLEADFLEVKKQITNYADKYKNLIFSEEEIKVAKKTRAELNSSLNFIEDIRKKKKSEYLKPLESFEKKIKELTNIIKEPIEQIDVQVKNYENKIKEEKKEILTEYFNNKNLFADLVNIETVWNERWLNATFPIKEAKDEIDAKLTTITSGLETIENSIASEFKIEIIDNFLKTLDLASALKRGKELEERKKKMEEYNKIQAEAKIKEEEQRRGQTINNTQEEQTYTQSREQRQEEQSQNMAKPIIEEMKEETGKEIAEEIRKEITIKFCLTRREMLKLNSYLNANGIMFHIINNQKLTKTN
jgi:hypothetical protein